MRIKRSVDVFSKYRKTRRTLFCGSLTLGHKYLTEILYLFFRCNAPQYYIRWLLNDCSNSTGTNSSAALTVSERRVAEAKWLFFVHFVPKNANFSLCPCGFWRFCYHGVITVFSFCPDYLFVLIPIYYYKLISPNILFFAKD